MPKTKTMANWNKENLMREDGTLVPMQVPVIVSASRSTDIPAFYADWFFYRLKVGYSAWTNPFNGQKLFVSFKNTRFIVFWSKNPEPLLKHLDELKARDIDCYIQYTLNDYENEHLEKVPPLAKRIDTFKRLVDKLGHERVIWRFDPFILTDKISIDDLLAKVEHIGNQLQGYTDKLVFSFADILAYRKVKANLEKSNIAYREWTEAQMMEMAQRLSLMNKDKWNFTLATCGEKIDLNQYGIEHNHCIDDELIIRLAYRDKQLMDFLNVKICPMPSPDLFGNVASLPAGAIVLPGGQYATHGDNRDKGQRQFCGCIKSKDIGEYNTCPHLCEYCYANTTKQTALNNFARHKQNPLAETITGE